MRKPSITREAQVKLYMTTYRQYRRAHRAAYAHRAAHRAAYQHLPF